MDETAGKVNGREVYAWAAMDVDTGELPAIKASWSSGPRAQELHGRAPLLRALEARANKPVFVVDGARGARGPSGSSGWSTAAGRSGDRSGVERFFGSLKRRTSASFKDINAGRSKIASLDMLMNIFFVYYNGLRFQ